MKGIDITMKGFYRVIESTAKNDKNKNDFINNNDDSIMEYITKAYMFILRNEDWGKNIPLDFKDDNYYHSLYLKYNKLTSYTMDKLKSSTIEIINEVIHRNPKSVRRTKKNSTRIYKNAIKAIKTYRSNEELRIAKKSIGLFNTVIRECFIISRRSLSSEVFGLIPPDLKITLNDTDYFIGNLYKFDGTTGKYILDSSLKLSKSAMKDIQYQIFKYIFTGIHDIFH